MEWKDFERLLFLAMAPVQSVAILSAGAFSLATDGPEDIVSRLIHMAKLQDPTIILVFSHFIISSYIFFSLKTSLLNLLYFLCMMKKVLT